MRLLVTLNMPSRKGELVHQVTCWHPCETLDEFMDIINESDFVLVEEFYRKQDNAGFFSVGMVILNTIHIGKVKAETSAER